jgi:hypothetical protein
MNFDLNIDNYSRDELLDIFGLPQNYNNTMLDFTEAKLKDSIINNKEINKETQNKTINFIFKAKQIILGGNQKQNNPQNNPQNGSQKSANMPPLNNKDQFALVPTKIEDPSEHMVQERKPEPFFSSYVSQFFQGTINPLKKKTIIKNLNIDSKFRDNYYSTSASNFHINLPMIINDVVEMQLNSIELPNSAYIISKQYGNNFFTVKLINPDGSSVSEVITVPDGNYGPTTIYNVINKQLALLSGDFAHIVFTNNFTEPLAGTPQTIVGFDGSQTSGASFELNFQASRFGIDDRNTPLPLKFGWNLGFRNGIYTNNDNYVSEGFISLYGPKYVYLVVDDHNKNVNDNFYSAFNSSILNKNILARITTSSGAASTFDILYQNSLIMTTSPRQYFGPVTLQTFDIQLLDEFGRILDLNYMDFSFCLTLTISYDV